MISPTESAMIAHECEIVKLVHTEAFAGQKISTQTKKLPTDS